MSNTNKQINHLICLAIVLVMVMGLAVTIFALKIDNKANAEEQVSFCEYNFTTNSYEIRHRDLSYTTIIGSSTTFDNAGWYYANSNVQVDAQNISPGGDIYIIVKSGVLLKFKGRFNSSFNVKFYGEKVFDYSDYGAVEFSYAIVSPENYTSGLNNVKNLEVHNLRSVYYYYPVNGQKSFKADNSIKIANGYQTAESVGQKTDYDNKLVTLFDAKDVTFAKTNFGQSNNGTLTCRLDKFINASSSVTFTNEAHVSLYAANIGINADSCTFKDESRIAYQDEHAGERSTVATSGAYGIKADGEVVFINSSANFVHLRYGIYAGDEITISGNSTNIDISDSRTVWGLYSNKGITINGGKIVALTSAYWDGGKIETTGTLTVNGGKVEGCGSPEGITAANIVLGNGMQFLGKNTRSAEYEEIALNDGSYAQYTKKPYMLIKQAPVPYLEYNETTGEFDENKVDDYNVVTPETTFDANGWYVVNSDVTLNANSINTDKDINLVLVDDCSLTIKKNVSMNSLNIYGQDEGSGTLNIGTGVDASLDDAKINVFNSMRIDGGKINVTHIDSANLDIKYKVLYVQNDVVMNGGYVKFFLTGTPGRASVLFWATGEFTMRGGEIAKDANYDANTIIHSETGVDMAGTINATRVYLSIQADNYNSEDEGEHITLENATINSPGAIMADGNINITNTDLNINVNNLLYALNGDEIVVNNSSITAESYQYFTICTSHLTILGVPNFYAHASDWRALLVSEISIPDGYAIHCKYNEGDSYTEATQHDIENAPYIIVAQTLVFDSFVWSEDGKTAQVKLVNPDDPTKVKYEDAEMSSAVQTPATCEVKGTTRYTATYGTETEYKDVQDIDALGHEYVYSEFEWAQGFYSAKAVYVCERDNTHIAKYDAQITSVIKQDSTETEMGISTITATYDGHSESKDVTDIPVKKKTLEDNGVSVQIKDGSVFDGHISIKVELKTSVKSKDTDDYAKILAKLEKDDVISKVYDVKLIKTVNGVETEIQPQDIKDGTVISVHMKLPQGIEAGAFRVLHIHSVDDLEFVDGYTQVGDELVFEVSKFSEFAFITKDTAHGFCIGWIALILAIVELVYACVYILIRLGLVKIANIKPLTFIGMCSSQLLFLFALVVLCLHQCAISIVAFIIVTILMCVFEYFFLKEKGIIGKDKKKQIKPLTKEEETKQEEFRIITQEAKVGEEYRDNELEKVKDKAVEETETAAEEELAQEKEETIEAIEAKEKAHQAITLKDSITLAKATGSSHRVTKKTIANYLKTKDIVEVNERENRTRTGLPLPDTHYVDGKAGKKCFAYVYETEGSVILLAKMDSEYADKLQQSHAQINKSAFPKQRNTWYSLIIDDTYTEEEVESILDELIGEVKEGEGVSLKESIALAKANTSEQSFTKAYVCEYLKDRKDVEVNTRENYTKTGLPLADTHYVEKDGKKICFAYVYEIEGSIILLAKMNTRYANELKKKHPQVHLSAFPKQKDTWYSLIIDDTYTKQDFDKILDDISK